MQRISVLVLGTLAVAAFALGNAQEATDKLPSHSVKFVLTGAEAESVPDETQLLKEGVSTDIPVMTTTKLEDGGIATEWGGNLFVPSPARMQNPRTKDDTETIAVGPRLTCRIRRIDEARVLIDATLSDTNPTEGQVASGNLKVTTHQLRSIQPVRRGDSVTLSWPATVGVEKPRKVTIKVLESK